MKKLLTIILTLALIVPSVALADVPDISDLSFDELVQLKERINLAIWNCQEWQEVVVPAGTYIIGKDIPEGHWSLRTQAESHQTFNVYYFDIPDEFGKKPGRGANALLMNIATPGFSAFGEVNNETIDIDMKNGWYLYLGGAVVFTPYNGQPDFGFR